MEFANIATIAAATYDWRGVSGRRVDGREPLVELCGRVVEGAIDTDLCGRLA